MRAEQRTGTKLVDIWYDVADADGNTQTVSILVSDDAGASFNVPATSFTGNYGPGVTPGNNRHVVWDAGADWNGEYSCDVQFRVTADDGTAPPDMVLIPAGSFNMGDTFNEGYTEERPVHAVDVSAFYMDRYEVTKAKWDEVATWAASHGYDISASDGFGKGVNHPVYGVSWYECVKWCNARSEKEGLTACYYISSLLQTVYKTGVIDVQNDMVKWSAGGYRLPTEPEWEKAARGGSSGHRFPWTDANTITHSRANYNSTTSYTYDVSSTRGYHPDYAVGDYPYSSPAGTFAANGYGLKDMAGNIWEWCWDWWSDTWYSNAGATQADTRGPSSGSYRLFRGGGWNGPAIYVRCAFRGYNYCHIEVGEFPGIACPHDQDAASHEGYQGVLQHLAGTPVDVGFALSQSGFSDTPVMIRTQKTDGAPIKTRISHGPFGQLPAGYVEEVDAGQGLHGEYHVGSGQQTFYIRPAGWDSIRYCGRDASAVLTAGRLFLLEATISGGGRGQAAGLKSTLSSGADYMLVELEPTSDSDADSLTDDFELRYFGNPASGQGANDDPDNDGLSNLWEQYMGLNPNDPEERFAIERIDPTPNAENQIRIELDTAPGVLYQVQAAAHPTGTWQNVGSAVEGIGGRHAIDIPAAEKAFIRVTAHLP